MKGDSLIREIRSADHGENGDERVLVLGGGHAGHTVANTITRTAGVTFVDDSEMVCDRARDDGIPSYCKDPTDAETLAEVGAGDADAAIVAMPADTETLLATQLLQTRFGVDTVVARADDPKVADHIGEVTDAVVIAPPVLAQELASAYQRVSVSTERW